MVSDLTPRQTSRVFKAAGSAAALLALLDALRALVLALFFLSGYGLTRGFRISPTSVSLATWLIVGLASFFVGIRLPPSFGWNSAFVDTGRAQHDAEASSLSPRASLARSLYSPNIGFIRELRRNCAHRFASNVAQEKSHVVALQFGREQREFAELFGARTSLDDVMRVLRQVRTYVEQGGAFPEERITDLVQILGPSRMVHSYCSAETWFAPCRNSKGCRVSTRKGRPWATPLTDLSHDKRALSVVGVSVPRMPSMACDQRFGAWLQARRASIREPLVPLPGVLSRPPAHPTGGSQRHGSRHRGRNAAPRGDGAPTTGPPIGDAACRPSGAGRTARDSSPAGVSEAFSSSRQPCCAGTGTSSPGAGPTPTAGPADQVSRGEPRRLSSGWRRRTRLGATAGSTASSPPWALSSPPRASGRS